MIKPLVLDTQLIILLVVGRTSVSIIGKHKRLKEYTEDDFELLERMIEDTPNIILLPNTVTEASNHLRQHGDPERAAIMSTFKEFIKTSRERYIVSTTATSQIEYERQGVTDSAIIACCKNKARLLTADLNLFLAAKSRGIDAVNFNHRREDCGLV